MASGHLQRTSCSRYGCLSRLYGEGNVIQGGGNSLQIKEPVTASIEESRAGNSASHFGEYAASEQALIAGKGTTGTTQAGKQTIGVPATQSKNPLNPVQQYDVHGNEIVYRTMSPEQFKQFERTGVLPAATETSISPVLGYSSKYDGVTVKIAVVR